MSDHKGWYTPRKLPHYDTGDVNQFITFRLADSVPTNLLDQLEEELRLLKGDVERERTARVEKLLDLGHGSCVLHQTMCAEIVHDSLHFLDGTHYDLVSWVIMPNHVHFLARFNQGQSMPKALHALKSFTSNEIKKVHPQMGAVWMEGYFDRFMRSEEHYLRTIGYIHGNPVVARLCDEPGEFRWSSAYGNFD
ncbi:MAG: transposase [Armatimonadetes bacterium]|nr:transposase [Armatimonadota bacterium]